MMRLYYYDDPRGNFGDDLNLWLWPKLLPRVVDCDDPYYAFSQASHTDATETLFIGIGSLINHHVPTHPRKVVLGAGVGYGDLPSVDDRWSFYAVRGPLSAKKLELPQEVAITDAGVLVRVVDLESPQQSRHPVSFMAHHQTAELLNWQAACRLIGINFIDPASSVDTVLLEITSSGVLLTESLHGAVVADALRVPWVPVRIFHYFNEFKWADWCQSLGLEFKPPVKLSSLHPRANRSIKARLHSTKQIARVLKRLKNLVSSAEPILSQSEVVEEATEKLLTQVQRLAELRSGC